MPPSRSTPSTPSAPCRRTRVTLALALALALALTLPVQAHPEVLTPRTAYALLTMGSLAILTPLALLMEWSGAGASRLAAASTSVGTLRTGWRLAALLGLTGLVQYPQAG